MTDTKSELIQLVNLTVAELEGKEYSDAIDWLNDQLHIEEYRYTARGEFKGAIVLCCTGGPHVEVDTARDLVTGYWGGDVITRSYEDALDVHGTLEECAPYTAQ